MGSKEHQNHAPKSITVAVLSVSTTRSLHTDESGHWIVQRARREDHQVVFHDIVNDDINLIRRQVAQILADPAPQAIIITGGTGITPRDVTIEAIKPMFSKELTAFSTLFTLLSFEQIDSAALLSRATAGIIGQAVIFCLPGSLKACQLACKNLIFPELGHLIYHLTG
jgi:molybdenum cofactor biosynthesis protein B